MAATDAPASGAPDDLERRRRQALYRASYRGTKETDILVGTFARARLGSFDADQLAEFEAILEMDDADLLDWCLGRSEVPADKAGPVLRDLVAFRMAGETSGTRG